MVTITETGKRLSLEFDNGIVDGVQKYKSKSISRINTDATDENLYTVAEKLSGLQNKTLMAVKRVETAKLGKN